MKIRLCLFDDSQRILDSLMELFSMVDNFEVCGAYNSAEHAVSHIVNNKADIVLMDIDMPVKSGIQAIKDIRKSLPTIPIMMFTVFEDDDKIFEAICAGANSYMLKNTEPMKLIDSVNELLNGGAPMSPGIARKVVAGFQRISVKNVDEDYSLTQREQEVLKLLTKGLSYKMIAADCNISFETVRSHIKNIYSKLHVASMTEAVAKAINERIV